MIGLAKRDIKEGEMVYYDIDIDTSVHNRTTWSQWKKAFEVIGYNLYRHIGKGQATFEARPRNQWGKYEACGIVRWFISDGTETEELQIDCERALIDLCYFTKKHILFIDGKGPQPEPLR